MRRHELDLVSLTAGLLAIAGAVLYLLHDAGRVTIDARAAVALGVIGLGAMTVAGAATRWRRQARPEK